MSFVSFAFFVFVGITVLAYYCVPKQYRWTVLLISSGIFYVMAASWLALWIIFTILTTFFAGLWMEKIHNAQKAALQQAEKAQKKQIRAQFNRKAKRLLVAVLVCNFGVLAAFKYLNLFSPLAASIAIGRISSSLNSFLPEIVASIRSPSLSSVNTLIVVV